jgi:hypothetical protein
MIDGEAPSQFSITVGEQITNSQGDQYFVLRTHAGFQAWSEVSKVDPAESSSPESQKLPVNYYDFPEQYYSGYGQDAGLGGAYFLRPSEPDSLPVTTTSSEAMFTLVPTDEGLPQYYRETSLQDSVEKGSMKIDVEENFQEFSVESITIPSGYNPSIPQPYVQGEESFSETFYFFVAFNYPYGMDRASDEVLIAYPDIDNRSVGYYIDLTNASNNSISVAERIGDQSEMPSSVSTIDAEASFSSKSLDDVQMSVEGSADFAYLYALETNSQQLANRWSVWMPDSTTTFTFPKIADSLSSSVTGYSRSSFELNDVELWDTDAWDGYTDYLNEYYGQDPYRLPFNYRLWEKQLLDTQNKISPLKKKQRREKMQTSGHSSIPPNVIRN